jgi:hypothetical protein
MKIKSTTEETFRLLAVMALVVALLAGCAWTRPPKAPPMIATGQGTVIYLDKYEFKPPPARWRLMQNVEGGDFELGFMLFERGEFPSQTTFMYDDLPYGSSQDLDKRADYYFTRFLFNSGLALQVKNRQRLTLGGRDALAIDVEGQNRVSKEKARSKVYMIKKGSRIISFVCTQWRPLDAAYSQEPFDHYDAFVQSFKFVKKDFYDEFEEEMKKAGL